MQKKQHNLAGLSTASEESLTERVLEMPGKIQENNVSDVDEKYLANLLNPRFIEENLEQLGYQIPKLYIQRQQESNSLKSEEFELPQSHDIYEETTFSEFQQILTRLKDSTYASNEVIYFTINYQAIWNGLQRK